MRTFGRVVGVVLLMVGLAAPLGAQTVTSGSLQGTIKDTEGGVLPGATVTVSSDALVARQMRAITDLRGIYRFPSLPPGAYTLEAELPGFATARQEEVRIRLGQALAVDITMQLAKVTEQVTVTGDAPLVSVVSNTVSSHFGQDFLSNQPRPNNYYNIIKAAPGVNPSGASSGSGMLAYGGTTESQNAFTLDGVNMADAGAGQHWILPAVQWMEEIQIGGLGANAEYGGYTGGIINGVTKSGGNEFHGGVELYYQPESWTSSNTDAEGEEFKYSDFVLSLGGPAVRDKLWFFVSGEYWRQVTTPVGAIDTSDRKIPRWLGKLTWQAGESNRVALMGEYDNTTHDRRGIDYETLPEAAWKQRAPGVSFSLNWENLINASNFVNVKLTGYDGRDDYIPYHGTSLPGRYDYNANDGNYWQNAEMQELNHRHVVSLDGSWSLFKDGLLGDDDSHAFKFGGVYERGSSSDVWLRNGGFTYNDDSSYCPGDTYGEQRANYLTNPACGADFIERGNGEYNAHPKYTSFAVYAQDSLKVGRWSVNYGVRYGQHSGGWQSGHGDSKVYDVDFVDPRIGFVWDVTGNSRSAVKAHWGRYHEKMYTYLFDREASGRAAIPDQNCYWNSDTNAYDDCDEPTYLYATIGDVEHPYVDETLLSFEHQFSRNLGIGLDLMDRRFRKIMAMVNVNDDYELYQAPGNPFGGGTLPIYNLLSAPEFVLTTNNGAYRDMQSVTLRMEKRYANGWSLRSSVVWTDMDGNIIKNNGYEYELMDKNGYINADGKMANYSEWEFKLSGAVDLPLGFQLSGQYTYLSGWYWTPYIRIRSLLDYNASTGNYIWLTPRGSQQLDDRHLVDLRLAWGTKLGSAMRVQLSLECFNVFNSDTVLSVSGRYGDWSPSKGFPTKPRAQYGTGTSIEAPRQLRAGIRIDF
ncbi:MAG: TonB-dependent receptor [Thermoanaerobaculaceae bacterium]|nr:TonB-dependent receptor [Thermoanaerobaculaceae bacterium]MDI9620998.1 TonB-dependent receptor [Acidobacteriota bacterium]NLH12129.1 TonB-dependent receptor [Holophagae bacterium]HPW56680.1 TonB-dependent receptor [Thermoanaerobaculaceae bacterium]